MSTKNLTKAAVFASLTCIATMCLQVKALSLYGYINLGDAVILTGSIFLSPISSMFAAGFGSALADIILGYFFYSPATLIIKGTMGFLASFMICKFGKKIHIILLAYALAEVIMIVFYTIYDAILYGKAAILATLPGNATQGVANLLIAFIFFLVIRKNKLLR